MPCRQPDQTARDIQPPGLMSPCHGSEQAARIAHRCDRVGPVRIDDDQAQRGQILTHCIDGSMIG